MGKKRLFTNDQIVEALRATGGFLCKAADLLGCCRQTVTQYIIASPELQEELEAIREATLDLAEGVLVTAMKGEDSKEAIDCAKFTLKYLGRGRGYIRSERFEVTDDISALMAAADKREKRNA